MSPVSYDTKSAVQGPAATLTMLGLAVGIFASMYRPLYGIVAGVAGAVVAGILFISKAKGPLGLLGRLGLGLAVGAAVAYGLDALGVLPKVAP
ncbi:MAG TPA: hypothetical protein VGK18_11390 [Propionicimonas sp.]|jgi:hypothetical protein|uniref:hypothetical protein n=1 Tax=Propionicimonas sp. TaxID=1955623 RepID=UPI002F3E2146